MWTRQYWTRSFTTYHISFDTFTYNTRISRSARYLVPIFIRFSIEFTMTARGTALAGNLDRIATRNVTIRLIFSYDTCLSVWSKLTYYHFLYFKFAYISNLYYLISAFALEHILLHMLLTVKWSQMCIIYKVLYRLVFRISTSLKIRFDYLFFFKYWY